MKQPRKIGGGKSFLAAGKSRPFRIEEEDHAGKVFGTFNKSDDEESSTNERDYLERWPIHNTTVIMKQRKLATKKAASVTGRFSSG